MKDSVEGLCADMRQHGPGQEKSETTYHSLKSKTG